MQWSAIVQKSQFCARIHHTFLSQQLAQHHCWPAARLSWRRHPSSPAASFIADDLAPWCRLGRQAADAANTRRGRCTNAEDVVVVPRSPAVALAPPQPRPCSPPALSSTAASVRARKQRRKAARVSRRMRRRTRVMGGPAEGAQVRAKIINDPAHKILPGQDLATGRMPGRVLFALSNLANHPALLERTPAQQEFQIPSKWPQDSHQ